MRRVARHLFTLCAAASLVLCAFGIACTRRGDANPSTRPSRTPSGAPERDLDRLIENARSPDAATRQLAVGRLFDRLTPGMTREDVERLIGPPDAPDEDMGDMTIHCMYYTRGCAACGTDLMSVMYRREGGVLNFVEVRGPHYPGG
jgi:hypothetical protein